ncbi:MAG: DUF2652 domain-containing protein [Bacteroidota bacterium]
MAQSLLFIPDISGFTHFVQNTEVEHSQHVIAELLEVLIHANTLDLQLAEIEGDALFFYRLDLPSQEKLLAQIETMFTAFYSHLKLLEKNRVCPCNACATAPQLQLKIVAHAGEMQFISVQDKRKPFGSLVIEAHRLLKNSIDSDNYALLTNTLAESIMLPANYKSMLYTFEAGEDAFDGKTIGYTYTEIDTESLTLNPFEASKIVHFDCPPCYSFEKTFPTAAQEVIELITNYRYRHDWVEGVDEFIFAENEVTRLGTEHTCVINGKHFDFETVTKAGKPGQIVYGEITTTPPPVDELYQFFILTPLDAHSCKIELELYWKARSPLKKLLIFLFVKKVFKKNAVTALENLYEFVKKRNEARTQ